MDLTCLFINGLIII